MIYGFVKLRAQQIILPLLVFTKGLAFLTCYNLFVNTFLQTFLLRGYSAVFITGFDFFPNVFECHSLRYAQFANVLE